MLLKNKLRAIYSRAVYGNVIAIIDHHEGKSVTNDAENVINDLARQGFDLSQYRVIYKDTRGIWDQMLIDRTGCFAGFSSGQRARPACRACQAQPTLTNDVIANRPVSLQTPAKTVLKPLPAGSLLVEQVG